MGKQVKDWAPPADAVEATAQEPVVKKNGWTPPEDAIAGEPVKKKDESVSPSASASAEVGRPSKKSSIESILPKRDADPLRKKDPEELRFEYDKKRKEVSEAREFVGKISHPEEFREGNAATDLVGGFNRAVFKAPSNIVKTFAEISNKAGDTVLGTETKIQDNVLYKYADKYDKWIDEAKNWIGDPEAEQRLAGQIGSGLGQIVTMIASAGTGSTPKLLAAAKTNALKDVAKAAVSKPTAVAFTQVFNSEYEQMLAQGESQDTAFTQAMINAVATAPLENLPLANLAKRLEKTVGGPLTTRIFNSFAQAGEEAAQESLQQILSNVTNNQLVEIESNLKDWSEGVGQSGEVGGIVGFILGAITGGKVRTPKSTLSDTEIAADQNTKDAVEESTKEISSNDIASIEKAADEIDSKVGEINSPSVQEDPVENVVTTDQTPTTQNLEEDAVQERSTEEVLQREPEGTGVEGGERGGVEQQQQGEGPTGTSVTQEEVAPAAKEEEVQKEKVEGVQQQSQDVAEYSIDVFRLNDDGTTTRQREPVTNAKPLKKYPSVEMFSHKTEEGKVVISEKRSGAKIVEADTLKEANIKLDKLVKKYGGEESFKTKVDELSAKVIEAQQKSKKTNEPTTASPGQERPVPESQPAATITDDSNGLNDTQPAVAEGISGVAEPTTDIQSSEEIIPPTSEVPPTAAQQKQPTAERKFARQILDDPNISDEVKQGLSQEAKTYIPKAMSITNNEAKAIIEVKGKEAAMSDYLDRSNGMTNDVRVTLGENLLRKFNDDKDFDNAVKVADNLAQFFTDLGRAVNAAKIFTMLTPEGVLKYVTKEVTKAKSEYSKKSSDKRKKSKEAVDSINKDAVEKILKDPKVKAKIISEAKKGSIKKAIDFLETLKVDTKGKALDAAYGLTAAAWNALITTVQKGLQAGLTISQAINKAVGKVTDKTNFDEKGARQFLDDKLKDYRVTLDPERAIKEELKAQNEKIENIIREHYTVVDQKKRDIVEKLVTDANLDKDQAEVIQKELAKEFDRLTKDAKEKALKKYLPKAATKKRESNKKTLTDKLVEASNLGALSEDQYKEVISEQIGVESLTPEQAAKITEMADKVQKAKEGFDKNNATERMMNYIESLKKVNWADVGMSIWYANILSGLSTQVLNISANFFETVGEVYTGAVMNPKQTGWIMKGLYNGWGRGMLEAMDTVKHGYQPTKFEAKISASSVLERMTFKGGKWNPYNYLKYISRIMNAADIFFYHGINEMRARELAVSLAKKQNVNQPGTNIIKEASKIIYQGTNPLQEAKDQAAAEGFTGTDEKRRVYEILEQTRPEFVIKDSNDEAARGTFNYDPEGTLGALTAGINMISEKVNIGGVKPIKFIIPFTRIIANVTNRYLDWTPVGLLRAAKGGIGYSTLGDNLHRKYTPQERQEVFVRAMTGVVAMVALYALTDEEDGEFKITANGTGDVQKNYELQETGWRPYSIKIGDTWYEYKNTPLAIPFATIGFIRDAEKYMGQKDLESKISIVMFGTAKYVMDLSFLQSLSSFMDTFSKDKPGGAENFFKKSTRATESTIKSFIIPNAFTQASRAVQEVMELPIKKANEVGDQIIRDMPILRDNLGNIYDALGDPVVPNQTERFIPLKPSRSKEDEKLWQLIVDNNAWIGKPRRATLKPNGDSMTDDEYEKYALKAGQLTKKKLQMSQRFLSRMKDKELVKDEIDNLKTEARREARELLFGF